MMGMVYFLDVLGYAGLLLIYGLPAVLFVILCVLGIITASAYDAYKNNTTKASGEPKCTKKKLKTLIMIDVVYGVLMLGTIISIVLMINGVLF